MVRELSYSVTLSEPTQENGLQLHCGRHGDTQEQIMAIPFLVTGSLTTR